MAVSPALLHAAHRLALNLAQEAGDTAVAALDSNLTISGKGAAADLVTSIDVDCESRMIARIRDVFSDHRITGEEHGTVAHGSSPWEWHLDPLDGTHNFVMGLLSFGVCLTLCYEGEPVVAVMHDSVRSVSSSAVRGAGGWRHHRRQATRLRLPDPDPHRLLEHETVSWVQGYHITNDDPFRLQCLERLRLPVKRVLHTWAPSIDWSLAAAGHVGAVILYDNQIHDMIGGTLLLPEVGGTVGYDVEHRMVVAGRPHLVEWVGEHLGLTLHPHVPALSPVE